MHELYCAGHLIAGRRRPTTTPPAATRLLEVARRYADHIVAVFGPAEAGKRAAPAATRRSRWRWSKLARATGDGAVPRPQAQYFVESTRRGTRASAATYHVQITGRSGSCDGWPATPCARCTCTPATADLVRRDRRGDAALDACRAVEHHGRAARCTSAAAWARAHDGEAFGDDYELPNARAYAETCAAIAARDVGLAHAGTRRRRALRRRDGTGALQRRPTGICRSDGPPTSTSIRWPTMATARIAASRGSTAPAARPTSRACSRRSAGYVYALGAGREVSVHLSIGTRGEAQNARRATFALGAATPVTRGRGRFRLEAGAAGAHGPRGAGAAHPRLVRAGAHLTVNGAPVGGLAVSRARTPRCAATGSPATS